MLKIANVPEGSIQHLSGALLSVSSGINLGLTAEQIVVALEPDAFNVLEYIANFFFPPAGTVIALVIWVIEHSETMNQAETNAWMARSGDNGSA